MECRGGDGPRPAAFAATCLGGLGGALPLPLPARERSAECGSTGAPGHRQPPTAASQQFPGQWGRRPARRSETSSHGWPGSTSGARSSASAGGELLVRSLPSLAGAEALLRAV